MSRYNDKDFESISFGTRSVDGGFVTLAQIAFKGKTEVINILGTEVTTESVALENAKVIHKQMEANWEKATGHPWPFDGRIEFLQ